MKPEEIIELAKKAAKELDPLFEDFELTENEKKGLMRFAALHREALIASGELVPMENVEADKQRLDWLEIEDDRVYNIDKITAIGGKPFNVRRAIDRARSQP